MHLVVIGGGISGLSAAWYSQASRITIIEKENRLGGLIQSTEQNGFFFERSARSLRPAEKTVQLISELGLQEAVVPGKNDKRYLYLRGKLNEVSLKAPWIWPYLPALCKGWIKTRFASGGGEESVATYFERLFGKRVTHDLLDALVQGIYAGDIQNLSKEACFPTLFQKRKKSENPWIRELQKESLFTLRGGMETLIHALQKKLQADFLLNREVRAIDPDGTVHTDSESIRADCVVIAIPANALAKIYPSELLQTFQVNSVQVVQVAFATSVLKREGFGYLIPTKERDPVLGCVFDSSAFPHQSKTKEETRLTVMLRETNDPLFHAERVLKKHLHIREKPTFMQLRNEVIPQYRLHHKERVQELQKKLPYLHLAGYDFYGPGVSDCISRGYSVLRIK